MPGLTIEEVRKELNAKSITIKKTFGQQWRVNFKGGRENTAHYADTLDEALAQGRVMGEMT